MSKPIFYKGQEVGCLIFGEGVVNSIHTDETYPVKIDCKTGEYKYTIDGHFHRYAIRPTLYPIDQYREIIANLPAPQPEAWKPKPGEWCWFWDDHDSDVAILNKFIGYDLDKAYPYMTITGGVYHNCAPFTGELPPHLKEVQP